MTGPSLPRIFISYAHESEEHKNRVLQFCGQLRQSGLDSWMDAYEPFPPQGWPQWMLHQIKRADFVLIVCSESLLRRFEGDEPTGKGKGAKWEGTIVTHAIYDVERDNRKFIPIVVNLNAKDHIPTVLRPFTYFDVSDQVGKESLYRLLTDQPAVIPPPIGNRHSLAEAESGVAGLLISERSSDHARVQADISFTTSSGGWTVLLKVVNASEIPLYLENPKLVLALQVDSDHELPEQLRQKSAAIDFFPATPISGPLLPTQQRSYFLPREALAIIRTDKRLVKAKPSVRISTAVGEELRLDDEETAEKLRALLGMPTTEGRKRKYELRMPLVMGLLHKRCSDQAHTGFKVYPPREVLDDPDMVTSDDVIDKLADARFRVEFEDGASEVLTMPELMVFTHQQIFLKLQMDEFLQQLDKSGVQQSVQASLNTTFNVEQIMHPELVKVLFSKIGFESTVCDDNDQKQRPKRQRKAKATKKNAAVQNKTRPQKKAIKKSPAKKRG